MLENRTCAVMFFVNVCALSYFQDLKGAERVQVGPNTLTCRVERDGPVLLSFFGGLGLGQVTPRDTGSAERDAGSDS